MSETCRDIQAMFRAEFGPVTTIYASNGAQTIGAPSEPIRQHTEPEQLSEFWQRVYQRD